MFKRKGGGGGQRPFEQCSKKLHFSLGMASLSSQAEHDGPKSSGVQLMDYGNDGEIAQPAIL